MSLRKYYLDSYTHHFQSRISEVASLNGQCAAILEETYFYPSSGGQPHDTGRLSGAAVVDVSVRESDGAILHLLDDPLEPGPVEGRIDWPRRFDHMQQHSGQHILSQAFERVAGAPTIGFHLGADHVSIDLGNAEPGDPVIAEAETLANEVVNRNLGVRAWFPGEDELRALALRKQPAVSGPVRVVAIGDFDVSACGGTHVASTGELGLIAVLRTERLKRGLRVEFLCGDRARHDYARKHAILRELSASLTCAPGEVSSSVARLQHSVQESRRELAAHQERELDAEAEGLIRSAEQRKGIRIVRCAWAERPMEQVKGLALRLTERAEVIVLLGVAGLRAQLLFGRSEQLNLDLKPAFDLALGVLGGGRGGGVRLLQGAAGPAELAGLEQALNAAETSLLQGMA